MDDSIKFDTKKLDKLNNTERLKWINPDLIWEALGLINPENLIDIGAGTGIFAKEFAKKIPEGKIYACDLSEIMVNWMQENLPDKNIIPILSKENCIELENNFADLVYMITVHHELLEPAKLLEESYRLLKNGGKIAVIDWRKGEMQKGPAFEIRVSAQTIVNQLQDAGFKSIVEYDFLPFHAFIVGQKIE